MFLQVCPVCEHRNPRGSRFCNDCGSPLQLRFCPRCHAAEDVMSLECRSCGERLPAVVLTDSTVTPDTLPPPNDTLWQTRAPDPAPFQPAIDGTPIELTRAVAPAHPLVDGATTVSTTTPLQPAFASDHAAVVARMPMPGRGVDSAKPATVAAPSAGLVIERELPLQALVAAVAEAADDDAADADGKAKAAATSVQTELPLAQPNEQSAPIVSPALRAPSIIERLSAARPTFEFQAKTIVSPPDLAANAIAQAVAQALAEPGVDPLEPEDTEPTQPTLLGGTDPIALPPEADVPAAETSVPLDAAADSLLHAESKSEIEVSDEAGTLVEASVAPVTYEPPVEITLAGVQVDDIADQLRSDAWRNAMPVNAAAMAPAVIRISPPPERRLSMRRVGLAVGSVAAIAAAVVFVRLHAGPGASASTNAAASAMPQQTAAAPADASPAATNDAVAQPAHSAQASQTVPTRAAAPAAVQPVATTVPAVETPAQAAGVQAGAALSAAVSTSAAARAADAVALPQSAEAGTTQTAAMIPAGASRPEAATPEPKSAAPVTRRAPIARAPEVIAPAAAHSATVETPRACTPAIAALGLCTLDPPQEKN